jgi:hypothetical protein
MYGVGRGDAAWKIEVVSTVDRGQFIIASQRAANGVWVTDRYRGNIRSEAELSALITSEQIEFG